MGVVYLGTGFFWMMSFAIKPWYWFIFKPDSYVLLGDVRLANSDYEGLLGVLLYILLGETIFLSVSALLLRKRLAVGWNRLDNATRFENISSSPSVRILTALYCFGWIGRLSALAQQVSIAAALTPFGTVASATLIIFTDFKSRKLIPTPVLVLFSVEIGWAFLFGSKAAAFIPALALVFRWAIAPNRKKIPVYFVLGIPALFSVIFLAIQTQRGILNGDTAYARSDGGVNTIKSQFIGLLERFDGASAIVDANAAWNFNKWLSLDEFIVRMLINLVPKGPLFPISETLGQQWTREVVSQSKPFQFQDVSLAAGFWAEGLALAGLAGLLIFALIQATLVAKFLPLFEKGDLRLYFLFSFLVFSPTLWEQGLLGTAVSINKGIQVGLVFFLFWIFRTKSAETDSSKELPLEK
jgi:hypothetical protein